MKQQTRELLVTTRVAQHWQDDFEQKVDELITLVSKVDTEVHVQQASEMMDVYRTEKQPVTKGRKKKQPEGGRPFEFMVFRN